MVSFEDLTDLVLLQQAAVTDLSRPIYNQQLRSFLLYKMEI
jgi:hypothetical protein